MVKIFIQFFKEGLIFLIFMRKHFFRLLSVLIITAAVLPAFFNTGFKSDVNAQASRIKQTVPSPTGSEADTFKRYKEESDHVSKVPLNKINTIPNTSSPDMAVTSTVRTDLPSPITKKVLMLNFDPLISTANNQPLHTVEGWYDPVQLANAYAAYQNNLSAGYITYKIVNQQNIRKYPVKADGFKYTDTSYFNCLNNPSACHSPDLVDYLNILSVYNVCSQLNAGTIDEVWLFGGPYFGYWEATTAGPNSFYTNAPYYDFANSCGKIVNIMGFNYQVPEPFMNHDLIHRFEGTMNYVYNGWKNNPYNGAPYTLAPTPYTAWDKFALVGLFPTSPVDIGTAHFTPNSSSDYDYYNTTNVVSTADDWLNYPNLTGKTQTINCSIWGCTDAGYYHWWFNRLPRYAGTATDGKLNNWWGYVANFANSFKPNCTQTPQVTLVSPANGYAYQKGVGYVYLSVKATFNTCNGYRRRDIWVKDTTLGTPFQQLCSYSLDTGNTTFGCWAQVTDTHQYNWVGIVHNENKQVVSPIWSFSVTL